MLKEDYSLSKIGGKLSSLHSFLWDDISATYNARMPGKERTPQQLRQFFDTFKKKAKARLKITHPELSKNDLAAMTLDEWKSEVKRCQDLREGTY